MTHLFSKAILVAVFASFSMTGLARANGAAAAAGDGFARGNSLYAAGDFAGAAGAYESQVRGGDETANLFYNLANAYYRQGNRGRAILNYQRALILEPTHAEAAANLAFVRGGKPGVQNGGGWVATKLPWATAAAVWVAVAGLVMMIASRRARFAGGVLVGTGLIAAGAGVVLDRTLDDNAVNAARAVVIVESAPALYAPADNSKVVTTLTAGGEVRILSDQGAWVYAGLSNGTRAWVGSDKVERIVPR